MSDVLVLNTSGTLLGIVDDYYFFEEYLRYYAGSSFKMYIDATAQGVSNLVTGNLIKVADNDEVYLIEQVERELDEQGYDTLTITGRAAGLLTDRLCLPPTGFSHDTRSGPAETVMKGLVEGNAVGSNVIAAATSIPTAIGPWASATNLVAFIASPALLAYPGSGAIQVTKQAAIGDNTFGSNTGTAGFPVTGNTLYTVMGWCKLVVGQRNFKVDVTWYTAAGATISTSSGVSVIGVIGSWVQFRTTFTSPATAAFARLVPYALASAIGDVQQWAGLALIDGDVRTFSLAPGGAGNRRVTNLVSAADQGRGTTVVAAARYQYLSKLLEEIGLAAGVGWKTYLSGTAITFDVMVGVDRSATVYLDREFDTVNNQRLLSTNMERKNFAYAAGQGEGVNRQVIQKYVGGSEPAAWSRREAFIDARDIDSTAATAGALDTRASQALAELQPVDIFEVEANVFGSFRYQRDWDLGDIVTARNSGWGSSKAVRIIMITKRTDPAGETITVQLDRPWPDIKDKTEEAHGTGGDGGSGAVDYHSENHASRHATGGADPLTAAAIGALGLSGGTLTGPLLIGGSGAIEPTLGVNPAVGNAPSTYPLGITQHTLSAGAKVAGWPIDVGTVLTVRESNTSSMQIVVETATGIVWQRASTSAGTGWTTFARLLGANMKRAMCYRTTTQSVPNSTDTVVSYNAELYDIGNIYDLAGLPDRFTLSEIGLWFVWSAARFAAGGVSAERYLGIFTGSTITTNRFTHDSQSTAGAATLSCSAVVRATSATEIVRSAAFQSSGGALNITAEFTYGTSMGAMFLGDYA